MIKYLLIFILTITCLAKKELTLQNSFANGRWGFQCLDSNDCYTISWSTPFVRIHRSKDKGFTWEMYKELTKDTLEPFPQPFSLSTLEMGYVLDSNHIYFIDNWQGNYYFYTDDGFETVQSKEICRFGNSPSDFMMFDSLNGMIVNSAWFFQTKDNWNTWDSLVFKDIVRYNNIYQYNDSTVFMSAIQVNQDGEEETYDVILVEYNINQKDLKIKFTFPELEKNSEWAFHPKFLNFIDDKIGFMGGNYNEEGNHNDSDFIFKTTDGGETWYKVLDEFNCCFRLNDIAFKDENYGITVDANKYYETFDGGETWHYGFFPIIDNTLHVLCFVEFAGDRCLIGSLGRGMYAWEEVPTKAVEASESNIMVWNGGSSLRIGSDQNNLEIIIFDLLGNQIHSEIFNKNTIIDLSNYSNSSYVFHIHKNGAVVRSGKFLKQ